MGKGDDDRGHTAVQCPLCALPRDLCGHSRVFLLPGVCLSRACRGEASPDLQSKRGILQKESQTLKNWNNRYTVVQKRSLCYFEGENQHTKRLGSVDLQDCDVFPSSSHPCAFEIVTPEEHRRAGPQRDQFHYIFRAESEVVMKEWVQVLQVATRPIWIPDSDSTAARCFRCSTDFTLTQRRHHCRRCGFVFCVACSDAFLRLPNYGYTEPVRVCLDCAKGKTVTATSRPSPVDEAKKRAAAEAEEKAAMDRAALEETERKQEARQKAREGSKSAAVREKYGLNARR